MPDLTVKSKINLSKVRFLAPVNESHSTSIQIFVKTLQGKTISTTVAPTDLILAIMEQVAEKTEVPILDQRLLFGVKQLDPSLSVQDYNLQKENTLHLAARLEGGIGEHKAVQRFIRAQIVHGNVTNLVTKESDLALDTLRDDNFTFGNELVLSKIKFNRGYRDPQLQELCKESMLTEGFHGGNCNEMADWTAVQLIENTTNQWVYICGFVGRFPLKDGIYNWDRRHPLHNGRKIDNRFDHVMVITYHREVESIADMNPDRATVVDTWYNHLVCSLGDYMTRLHPYYNYQYSSKQGLKLKSHNLAIKQSFACIGYPFCNNKKEVKKHINTLKEIRYEESDDNLQPRAYKYEFDIQPEVHDCRNLGNLENLLLRAAREGRQVSEINAFDTETFEVILGTNNNTIVDILLEAANNINQNAIANLCSALETAQPRMFALFCSVLHVNFLKTLFKVRYANYEQEDEFVLLLDHLFEINTRNKTNIFKALSNGQFYHYCASSTTRLVNMMGVTSIKERVNGYINSLMIMNWTELLKNATTQQIRGLLNSLIVINKQKTAMVIKQLNKKQFHNYFINKSNLKKFCSSEFNHVVLKAIFAQFKAFGIEYDDKTTDKLSLAYARKLKAVHINYWNSYGSFLKN